MKNQTELEANEQVAFLEPPQAFSQTDSRNYEKVTSDDSWIERLSYQKDNLLEIYFSELKKFPKLSYKEVEDFAKRLEEGG
ncbi:MAG: hypothetical protein JWM20_789 [Patescibacteria group bacterium]|nr:hypothetical protein [Patescibacteria group bacterium]